MTSVPNRLLRLNGNSIGACCLIFISFLACAAPKVSKKTPPPEPPKTEDKVSVYDPATGTYILVPRDAVKVDTVKWTVDPSAPLVTDKETKTDLPEKKSRYNISVLMPLNAGDYYVLEGQLDPKLIRSLQYYAGMKIAVSEFKDLNFPVTVQAFDTKNSILEVREILKSPGVKNADVVIGPNDKENVEIVAAFGLQFEKMIISPWLPAFNIEDENPFFIQVVPGLNTHAEAIMDYIGDEFRGKKVYLVARNNTAEINRLQLFKKNPNVRTEDLIIDDASVDLQRTNLSSLLNEDGTIFVLPYYSRSDETFVNSFMRKLHADKEMKEVIVFGLPQWTGFNNLNSNYMESLAVHISSSSFIDTDHPSYRSFRTRFYDEFHTLPDPQAYMGYDLIHWLGMTLSKEGPEGLIGYQNKTNFGLVSGFVMKPVFKTEAKSTSEFRVPLYYENTRLRILKFVNQDFMLVR